MLPNVKALQNCKITASGGRVTHVTGLYFDDHQRIARYLYLLMGASSWLSGHKVSTLPIAIHAADRAAKGLPVSITRELAQDDVAHRRGWASA